MQCYNPRLAFRSLDNTRIKFTCKSWSTYIIQLDGTAKLNPKFNNLFSIAKNIDLSSPLKIPCGKCEACVLNRAGDTARRAYHEFKSHDSVGMFITLTYSDENKPSCGHFDERDIVLFVKRLRKISPKIRTLGVAEYGERTKRPHFHLLVFGHIFSDKKILRQEDSTHAGKKYDIFESKTLQQLWNKGRTEFGSVTEQSCSYVARYLYKKSKKESDGKPCDVCQNKKPKKSKIVCRSRRPGLGADFCDRYITVDRIKAFTNSDHPEHLPRYYIDRACKMLTDADKRALKGGTAYEQNRDHERKERLDALKIINIEKLKKLFKHKI